MTRAATLAVFAATHRYAGVAVGEHLGYPFTAAWTLVIALSMPAASRFRPWLGWVGIVAALGILVGLIEPAGFGSAGTVNAVAYVAWSLWLVGAGVSLLMVRPEGASDSTTDPASGIGVPAPMLP